MAIGYKLPNGTRTMDSRGFYMGTMSEYQFTSGYGAQMTTYYVMCRGGNGYIRSFQTSTNWIDRPYPEDPGYCTSGGVYVQKSGDLPQYAGNITTDTYYAILKSAGNNGSIDAPVGVWPGDSATVKAVPDSGYIVRSFNGVNVQERYGEYSTSITPTSDTSVSATFASYYSIKFDQSSETIGPCTAGNGYVINVQPTAKEGYFFAGWATSKTNADSGIVSYQPGETYTRSSVSAGQTVTLYAVWTQARLVYDPNGGYPTPEAVDYYGNVTLADAITHASGFAFCGWLIGTEVYAAGATYNLVLNMTAIAQWTNIAITNKNTDVGTISLFSVSDNRTVAEEGDDGILTFSGTKNKIYRVDATSTNDLYEPKGAYVDGDYIQPYQFTLGDDSVARDFFFRAKDLFSIQVDCDSAKGSVSITPAASTQVDGVDKWYTQDVTFTVTPNAGWDFVQYNIIDIDSGSSLATAEAIGSSFVYPELKRNIRVVIGFERQRFRVGVGVDDASVYAGSAAITLPDDSAITEDIEYGNAVKYSATANDGYEFEGWYADGVTLAVSNDNPYLPTVTSALSLRAKFKVAVSMEIEYLDNASSGVAQDAVLTVNGEAVGTSYSGYVTLGNSLSYAISVGGWYFNAWFAGADRENPLEYEKDGTIYPTEQLDITAQLTSQQITHTVTVVLWNNNENARVIADEADVIKFDGAVGQIVDGNFVFDVAGSKVLSISARTPVVIDGEEKAFQFYSSSADAEGSQYESILSRDEVYSVFINSGRTIYACYGTPQNVKTTVKYGIGDRTTGYIGVDGATNEQSLDAEVSAEILQGEVTTIVAMAKNGYMFVGWYTIPDCVGTPFSTSAETEITVTSERTFYARFAKNPNAIYEWEGSDERKMMEWRSKVYVSSKPFNPSACRVDTEGYPLGELSIEMFSAPDSVATAVAKLENVASQTSRRLPIRRMERYIQIAVKNDREVDAVIVGTSMGGLAV